MHELWRSKERFRAVLDSLPDALIVVNEQSAIREANTRAGELFGYAREELLGRSVEVLIPERFRAQHREHVSGYCAEPRMRPMSDRSNLYGRRKDGSEFPADIHLAPLQTADGLFVLGSVRDISAPQKMAEALRESEERHRLIVETALDACVAMGESGVITGWNARAEAIFGWTKEEAIGQTVAELVIPPPHREAHRKGIESFLATGKGPALNKRMELSALHRDGHEFPIEICITAVRLGGRFIFNAFIEDISERKQAEKILAGYIRELARSNADLEQFAYVASHDLQEPLRMVASYVQLLAKRYRGRLDSDADEFIAFAVDGANRMRKLIDDLLAYSRAGRRKLSFQRTDCQAVFDQAVANLHVAIEECGARVTCDALPTITADASQLAQLFQNLIGNALKFRGEAPPRIHLSAKRKTNPESGAWLFTVRDNGLGFDPSHAEQVFTAFKRLHDRREYPGSGIGLAICKRVVERHGGRIWAESNIGEGSTFCFTIADRNEETA